MYVQPKYALEWQDPLHYSRMEQTLLAQNEASGIPLFDQFEHMLIYNSRQEADAVLACIPEDKRSAIEPCDLLLVTGGAAVSPYGRYEDFTFRSSRGHVYFDLAYVDVFRLLANKPEAEPAPALMQLKEHLIAEITGSACGNEAGWQVIERQLAELADRVARAYRCGIEWLDTDHL